MFEEGNAGTLHGHGWRQGSVFHADLVAGVCQEQDAAIVNVPRPFGAWVVASQDCDLDGVHVDHAEALIEIRPVRRGGPLPDWGVRSRRVRLADDAYVDAADPRLLLSPAALNMFRDNREEPLADSRAKAFKKWLGLRYDRPALPPQFGVLAKSIATAVRATRTPELADGCHDILMQFQDGQPCRYAIWAVVLEGVETEPFAEWLARAALQVPDTLGLLAAEPRVVTKAGLSLEVIENSYAADLTMLTYAKEVRGAE